jgi:hypothetical protein
MSVAASIACLDIMIAEDIALAAMREYFAGIHPKLKEVTPHLVN